MIIRQCLSIRLRCSLNQLRFQSIPRINPLGIQMLSSKLHKQLFASVGEPIYSEVNIGKSKVHLEKFQLGLNESEKLDDIEFDLPPLESENINEHFEIISRQQSKPYVELIDQLIKTEIPAQPTTWIYAKGWTKFV
jgi:DNA polymerase gamma 1